MRSTAEHLYNVWGMMTPLNTSIYLWFLDSDAKSRKLDAFTILNRMSVTLLTPPFMAELRTQYFRL